MKNFISVDPGSGGTGIAVWSDKDYPDRVCILQSKFKKWEDKVRDIGIQFKFLLNKEHHIKIVYIEDPHYFDTAMGRAVAIKGDLGKLTFIVGFFGGICFGENFPFALIPVKMWKGQLPKEIVMQRIKEKLGNKICRDYKSHVWDAVGIGLYIKNVMDKGEKSNVNKNR